MSIASYRRNVQRRVTNAGTETCLPAALEQISPKHSYRPSIYKAYKDFVKWQRTIPARELNKYPDEHIEMTDRLVWPLGRLVFEDLVFKRATTPVGFAREVGKLLLEEFRVAAEITYISSIYDCHCVGIIPTGEKNHVTLVSNHIPKGLQGIVTLRQVGEHVSIGGPPFSRAYPFMDANIYALPPVD